MKKNIFSIFILMAVLAVFPFHTFANSYTSGYQNSYGNYGGSYAAPQYGCLNITANMYRGSTDAMTGGQVSMLQSFLISQGYLPIASPSGYYGVLTAQAVSRYQSMYGIPADGTVGPITRSTMNMNCGNNGYYNGYNGYNGYYYAPTISSLSVSSGYVGQSVTIYGSGFDLYNNTVNIDGVTLSGIPSYQGTALAFMVPRVNNYDYYNDNYHNNYNYYNNNYSQTYSVSVTNSRGTSNSMPFTVLDYYNDNNCYNYNGNYYDYNNCDNNGDVYLNSISPNSGQVGEEITLYGSGFTSSGNTVHFGIGGSRSVRSSSNGKRIYFTIPSSVGPCDIVTGNMVCAAYQQLVRPGTYPIYVSNSRGQTNTINFRVE